VFTLRNVALLLLVASLGLSISGWRANVQAGADEKKLLLPGCDEPLQLDRRGDCVSELQKQLYRHGIGDGSTTGEYKEPTQRHVFAFQELAGLPLTGVVDDATKRQLYDPGPVVRHASGDEIETWIRTAFPESPDLAVAVASCATHLDPSWVTNGPHRRWGVFALTDEMLARAGKLPRDALDPQQNITIARWLWERDKDSFAAWQCVQPPIPYDPRPA
jgi:hypothetical protein